MLLSQQFRKACLDCFLNPNVTGKTGVAIKKQTTKRPSVKTDRTQTNHFHPRIYPNPFLGLSLVELMFKIKV